MTDEKMREALEWALDEIDALSNRLVQWAYPQGMAMIGREDQFEKYRIARDVLSTKQEGEEVSRQTAAPFGQEQTAPSAGEISSYIHGCEVGHRAAYAKAAAYVYAECLGHDDAVRMSDGLRALANEPAEERTAPVAASNLLNVVKHMLGAIDGGTIDSEQIDGDYDSGIPPHKWHEEWAYYARKAVLEQEGLAEAFPEAHSADTPTPPSVRSQALLEKAYAVLGAAHSRIHCLPRTSDTELAKRIEQVRAEIEQSQKGEK